MLQWSSFSLKYLFVEVKSFPLLFVRGVPRRSNSRKERRFQYQQLYFKTSRRRRGGRTLNPVFTPPTTGSSPFVRRAHRQISFMDQPPPKAYPSFNQGSPLALAVHNDIPVSALKALPYYTGETLQTPVEYLQGVTNSCLVHDFIEDNLAVRLLASSLKGKAHGLEVFLLALLQIGIPWLIS